MFYHSFNVCQKILVILKKREREREREKEKRENKNTLEFNKYITIFKGHKNMLTL